MSLSRSNTLNVLTRLDEILNAMSVSRELTVCGGGALIVLNVIDRVTRDLDVVAPTLDAVLLSAARKVKEEFQLNEDWLNNGPEALASELPQGWMGRRQSLYSGQSLALFVLGRSDLLLTKIYAFCDREDDWNDLKEIKPSLEEIDQSYVWVLSRDASTYWPKRVEECFARLRKYADKGWRNT